MDKEKYFSIGKLVGTHALKGEMVLRHGLGKATTLKGLKCMFIQDKTGSFLPWFIEGTRQKNETEVFIKTEGIDKKEDARELIQKEVWLTESDFKKYAAKTAPINLLGYTILEGEKALGIIEEVIEQPHQIICRIAIEGKEVLIPLHEQTLKKIDQKNKCITVQLPEGLLDIYLA